MSEKIVQLNEDGFREVLSAAEGMKEDKASWVSFFQWLRGRGLDGVKLIVGDKCMGNAGRWQTGRGSSPLSPAKSCTAAPRTGSTCVVSALAHPLFLMLSHCNAALPQRPPPAPTP